MSIRIQSPGDVNALRDMIAAGALSEDDLKKMTLTGGYVATQPAPPAQKRKIRVVGVGGGAMDELGVEDWSAPPIDYTRPGIQIAGLGKGHYSADGRHAFVQGPNGDLTKVVLGYDRAATQRMQDRDLIRRAKEAEIAQTQAQTEQIGKPRLQLTPEGVVFNSQTGEISQPSGAGYGSAETRQQRNAAFQSGLKQVEKDDKDLANVSAIEQNYKRWLELNQGTQTGRISGAGPIAWGRSVFDPKIQGMQQLEDWFAVNNFKPGQGQISNYERGLMKGANVSVKNDPEVNAAIAKISLGAIQNMRERANFREAYLNAKRNLIGADQAWQQYLDANPRYVQTEGGGVTENPNWVDWQTHFSGGGQRGAASPAAPAPSVPRAAVEWLRSHPELRGAFDQKYGAGAADRALGGR